MDDHPRMDATQRIEEALATGSPVLDLGRCGLRELPDAVRRLTHLESLNLQFNSIEDLPGWLPELDRLVELNLQYNGFEFVPDVVRGLTGLRALDLSENNLESDSLDFLGGLTELTRLTLIDTRSDRLPASIGNLTRLTELDLYLGWFRDEPESLPDTLGRLTGLTRLELARNGLVTVPAWIRGLTGLRYLGLWGNEIAEVPAWIGELTALEELTLPGEPDETLRAVLRGMPNLTTVTDSEGEVDLS
jgi:Leucine-rich repeat (LRR) protein